MAEESVPFNSYANQTGPLVTPPPKKVYLIGSLRNPLVPDLARFLRDQSYDVFDDWYAAGPEADDYWKRYEEERGNSYIEAVTAGYAAEHVYLFDKHHLDTADAGVLLLPAGKSCHLELGYLVGQRKPTVIVLDTPDRWDVMYKFASGIVTDWKDICRYLKG